MKCLRNIIGLIPALFLIGCDPGEPDELLPVASFKILPSGGNTTTVFRFDAGTTSSQGTRSNPVLLRWDWDSDGVWDAIYSTAGETTHRFFKPGTYHITMEASTITGKRDTIDATIEVPRGYSPPRANFSMTPDSANITREFAFDASLSKDDEDSLGQLEFRWDLDGDGQWDTEFSGTPVISRRYAEKDHYRIRLEVRDPQQMTSIRTDTLVVTRLNDLIVPVVLHECWPCTLEDTVRFDASGSHYDGRPDALLLYSWDVGNDDRWEVLLSESPNFKTYIGTEGKTIVRLRVTDELGLYMEYPDTIELFPLNSPPVTRMVIGNPIGNTRTNYYLHLRASTDRDDSYLDLKSRWDVNDDGIWDPEYDGLYEINLSFPAPGKYPVTAMLTDPKNKWSTDTDTVWVVEGNHETGLISDRRGTFLPVYYGTVKVGNKWWMQSNLRYYPSSKGAAWHAGTYYPDPGNEERYGALYPYSALNSNNPRPCPTGWSVPSLADWQQLMVDLGNDATIERLLEGGRSEMHFVLAGQKNFSSGLGSSANQFSGLGHFVNFWTSTESPSEQGYAWYFDPIRRQNRTAVVSKNYWFPIRCIRDE
jgi:uncharacterized protein (TIGR02145 family)